jgi:RNase P/RNase MRP subunit p29
MGLHFKILDSTDPSIVGKTIELKSGMIIGRAKGHLIIEDERISSVHAEIQANNQGEIFLVDKDSRNGIKVQGKRITKLLLSPGTIFQIGNTLAEVIHKQVKPKTVRVEDSASEDIHVQAFELLESMEVYKFNAKKPIFFERPVKLSVIQGLQLNQSWQLEYGPFKFGSGCVGGLLVGKNMPLEVFEVYETNSGKTINVLTPERIVRLNTIPVVAESLIDNGDILSIHLSDQEITRIKFEF